MRLERIVLTGLLTVTGLLVGCADGRVQAPVPRPVEPSLSPTTAATAATSAAGVATAHAPADVPSGYGTESGTDGRKLLTYENVTFRVPESWQISIRGGVAGLGDFVARPGREAGPSLVVSVNSAAPVDEAIPTRCEGGAASSVDLVQAGFAPVGDRTADFRFWISSCEDGTSEERRAWVLPSSRVSFVEQYHVPANVEVVSSAFVA